MKKDNSTAQFMDIIESMVLVFEFTILVTFMLMAEMRVGGFPASIVHVIVGGSLVFRLYKLKGADN